MSAAQQLTFADTAEARRYKDGLLDAIAREVRNAEHVAAVVEAIRDNIPPGEPFSANSIRALLPSWIRPNSIGATFNMLHKRGAIRFQGYETSTKKNTHGAKLAQWIRVS